MNRLWASSLATIWQSVNQVPKKKGEIPMAGLGSGCVSFKIFLRE